MGQESAEADAGVREGFSTSFARRSRWLERELKELHRASERLKLASALFDFAELNRWILDRYRDTFGLENPLTNDCYWPEVETYPFTPITSSHRVVYLWLNMSLRIAQTGFAGTRPMRTVPLPSF